MSVYMHVSASCYSGRDVVASTGRSTGSACCETMRQVIFPGNHPERDGHRGLSANRATTTRHASQQGQICYSETDKLIDVRGAPKASIAIVAFAIGTPRERESAQDFAPLDI